MRYEQPLVFANPPDFADDYDTRTSKFDRKVVRNSAAEDRRSTLFSTKLESTIKKTEEAPAAPAPTGGELADISEIPVCKHLCISPSVLELSRMTRNELKRVNNLSVWNDFGRVQWTGPVNLLGVNLDNWVQIGKNSIEIEDVLTKNVGCTLHFFNFGNFIDKAKNPSALRSFKTRMSQWLRSNKLKMVSFS